MTKARRSIGVGTGNGWPLALGGALVGFGIGTRSPAGLAVGAAGGAVLYATLRGLRRGGRGASLAYQTGIRVDQNVHIDKPPEEVFAFWRKLENLPRFMTHLESVTVLDPRRSHWVAKGPAGKKIEWDAEIVNERANGLIGWRSLPGSDVDHAGSVRFERGPGGRSTNVIVSLQYDPPGGMLGAGVAKILGEDPHRQIREDLYRLKRMLESGEAGELPHASSF